MLLRVNSALKEWSLCPDWWDISVDVLSWLLDISIHIMEGVVLNWTAGNTLFYEWFKPKEFIMNLSNFFLYLALAAVIFNVVVTMIIISKLSRMGVKINIVFLRLLFPKYVHQYKKLVTQETGKESPLYYFWLVSINLALALCILGLLIKFIWILNEYDEYS
jgi:uncharacterized membrane protein YidH (DUF202 family)